MTSRGKSQPNGKAQEKSIEDNQASHDGQGQDSAEDYGEEFEDEDRDGDEFDSDSLERDPNVEYGSEY